MKIFKVTLYGGYCYLEMAATYEAARKQAMNLEGSANVQHVELATPEDVAWIKAMGGPVPELPPRLPSEWARKGFYVIEGNYRPKAGDHCDYYDRDGIKRQGTIRGYDGEKILIDGERKVIVQEEFKIKFGR